MPPDFPSLPLHLYNILNIINNVIEILSTSFEISILAWKVIQYLIDIWNIRISEVWFENNQTGGVTFSSCRFSQELNDYL